MIRRAFLRSGCALAIGALGGLAAASGAPAQDSWRLRIGGQADEWLEYNHQNDVAIEFPDDLGGRATTRTSIRLRQSVDSVAPGSVRYLATLDEVSFTVEPEPAGLPDLAGLEGLRFWYTVNRIGRTTGLELPGGRGEAGPGFREQLENWLSQLGFPPLAAEPVAVGDQWTESVPIPASALGLALEYDLMQARTTRLEEVRRTGTTTVAILHVNTRWEPSADRGEATGVASLRGSAEQTVRFDIGRGRFLGSTGTSSLDLVIAPPGSGQFVAVSATGRQITRLTASGEG
jgi:hypothetical protein